MTVDHVSGLARAGLHPELWRLQPSAIGSVEDMQRYVEAALAEQSAGKGLPFVIVDLGTNEVVGSTRYMDMAPAHRRLEIGATWLTPSHQRGAANTEAKLLLLTHAFEVLGVQRVVLKTDALNTQSRKAILRLGAVQEGVFRKHLIADSGRARDMVYFSILQSEWPAVKQGLLRRSIPRFVRLSDSLATAGQPSEAQLEVLAADGFEVVVNLALHGNPGNSLEDEAGTVKFLGMDYVHIPVQFSSPALADLDTFCEAMENAGDRKVFVHCVHNKRVPVFIALDRVLRQRWSETKALEAMREVWQPDAVWESFITQALRRGARA